MISLWVPITLCAAFMQNLRTAMQRQLAASVDASGATLARYLFGFPFAIAYVLLLNRLLGWEFPALNAVFLINCLIGGVAQIIATVLLVASFSLRNFAAATTYSKTEVIFTAVGSAIVLGELVSPVAAVGILISFIGVVTLSNQDGARLRQALTTAWRQRAAGYAVGAGALFGVSSICFRGAAQALDPSHDVFMRAGMVLAITYTGQALLIAGYVLARHPGRYSLVLSHWRPSLMIGVTAIIGSWGWFTAVAMANAAYVRAVGQIEVLFSLLTAVLVFREKVTRIEVIGMIFTIAGIVVVLIGA